MDDQRAAEIDSAISGAVARRSITAVDPEDGSTTELTIPERVNGWEYDPDPPPGRGVAVWNDPTVTDADRFVFIEKTGGHTWMAGLRRRSEPGQNPTERINKTSSSPDGALTAARRLMENNDPAGNLEDEARSIPRMEAQADDSIEFDVPPGAQYAGNDIQEIGYSADFGRAWVIYDDPDAPEGWDQLMFTDVTESGGKRVITDESVPPGLVPPSRSGRRDSPGAEESEDLYDTLREVGFAVRPSDAAVDPRRAAEIKSSISGAAAGARSPREHGQYPERRRVGNTRFFWNDGVGGMAEIRHEDLPITLRARPREVAIFSRVDGMEIEVDHKPERDPIQTARDAEGTQQKIYAKHSEALEGVESIEDLSQPAQQVVEYIDMSHFRDRLEGRDGGLRPSKPNAQGDTGLVQYVWRMARFHSGQDPEMPVTAAWWLQDWLDDEGIDAKVSGILDDEGQQITAILDTISRMLVASFGQDPAAGADRWRNALFGGEGDE